MVFYFNDERSSLFPCCWKNMNINEQRSAWGFPNIMEKNKSSSGAKKKQTKKIFKDNTRRRAVGVKFLLTQENHGWNMTVSDRGRFFFPLNIHEHLLRSSFIRDQGSYHLLYKKNTYSIPSPWNDQNLLSLTIFFFLSFEIAKRSDWKRTQWWENCHHWQWIMQQPLIVKAVIRERGAKDVWKM